MTCSMCVQKLMRHFTLFYLLHLAGRIGAGLYIFAESSSLKEKREALNKILSKQTLVDTCDNIKRLTPKQFEIYTTLVRLYQTSLKWYDKYAIINGLGKEKGYRITLHRMLTGTRSKNLRGNKVFNELIETDYYHAKKVKQGIKRQSSEGR